MISWGGIRSRSGYQSRITWLVSLLIFHIFLARTISNLVNLFFKFQHESIKQQHLSKLWRKHWSGNFIILSYWMFFKNIFRKIFRTDVVNWVMIAVSYSHFFTCSHKVIVLISGNCLLPPPSPVRLTGGSHLVLSNDCEIAWQEHTFSCIISGSSRLSVYARTSTWSSSTSIQTFSMLLYCTFIRSTLWSLHV